MPARSAQKKKKTNSHGLSSLVLEKVPTGIRGLDQVTHGCEEHMRGAYKIQVVDLLERPTLARGDQIIAVPTLVRRLPTPVKKILGDLSNTERVLVGLDLRPAGSWR